MSKLVAGVAVATGILASPAAAAAERTVILAVQNMYCAACPHTVRVSLQAVRGVKTVTVSYTDKTAIVTYDDSTADVEAHHRHDQRRLSVSTKELSCTHGPEFNPLG